MPLTVYKRGKIYHYRGSVAGRRLRGSTGTSDKTIAQRIAADKEASAWKCNLDGPETVLTFAQAAILYRKAGKQTRFLSKVEDHWKDAQIKQMTAEGIREAAKVMFPHASGATRNRQAIVPSQAVINHAAKLGMCAKISVPRFEVTKKVRSYATWAWVEAFRAKANPHLGALACFMFLTGARITEALSLRWKDIDLEERKATIRSTKIHLERRPHLPAALIAAVANIESNREPDAKVFKYSSRDTAKPQWRKAIKRVGIKPLSFHACRHGFATAALRAGIDVITVAKLGGWKSPEHVFKTYGHALEDETVTDRLVDTPQTQKSLSGESESNYKKMQG